MPQPRNRTPAHDPQSSNHPTPKQNTSFLHTTHKTIPYIPRFKTNETTPMKKILYFIICIAAALTFQSCHSSSKSARITEDTTASGGIAIDTIDTKFVNTATTGGLAEIALAKLALVKSTNIAVKNFAQMMVDDHTVMNSDLAVIANQKSIPLPTEPDSAHMNKAAVLNKLSEEAFDKAYVAMMTEGHKKMVDVMNHEVKSGKDDDLKAFAAKYVSVVILHYNAIKNINDSMK